MAIDGEGGIWLLRFQHEMDGPAHVVEDGIFQRTLRKHRRIAGGDQQYIAFPLRHFQLLGEVQDHLAAGLRAPGFEKAQVARRDFGFAGQIELAEAAALPPLT